MNLSSPLLLVATVALLTWAHADNKAPAPKTHPRGHAKVKIASSPMQFQLSVSQSEFAVGEPITFSMKLRNSGTKEQEISFRSGQRFDILLQNAKGETVWSWAADKRFSQSLSKQTLAPNASLEFEAKWNGRLLPGAQITPGTYAARAVLTSNPRLEAPPVSLEIK